MGKLYMTIKDKILVEVQRLCKIANVPTPKVEFKTKGKAAGYFKVRKEGHWVDYNLDIAEANQEKFMGRTVPHELAHYIRWYRNGKKHDKLSNGKNDIHGTKWKAVMAELGATDISRCHDYKVKSALTTFEYFCSCKDWVFTSIRHNRSVKHDHKYYTCPTCKGNITPV